MGRVAVLPLLAAVLILAGFLGFWKVRYEAGHEAQGQAGMSDGQFRRNMMGKNQNRRELWQKLYTIPGLMPLMSGTCKKTAYVYLPYGYSEEKEYNILYLMHGTGDDEKYWLKTNPYNKTMLWII